VERQHHTYKHADVDHILDCLTSNPLERGAIPDSTLRHWHRQRSIDPAWFPLAMGHPQARAPRSGWNSCPDFVTAAEYIMNDFPNFALQPPLALGGVHRAIRGVSINLAVAAEYFKKAADLNDVDGLNSFGCCLERG
jgi:hypothetical protein